MLGTFVEIAATGSGAGIDAAFEAIARVERLMSPHQARSDIGRMNRLAATQTVRVDEWTFAVLSRASEVWAATDGLFDPTREHAFGQVRLGKGRTVRFERPITIDLGGIAKGWAVDLAVEILQSRGATMGSVNAGGDLRAFGVDEVDVFLREPETGAPFGRFSLREGAVASTAAYEEWTGRKAEAGVGGPIGCAPPPGMRSVTVRARECWLADALTKVVWLRGRESFPLLREFGADACGWTEDGRIIATSGWARATSP